MKLKDKLYKYHSFGRFAEYIITAVIRRDKLTTYEAECQSCSHGFKCRVLLKKVRKQDRYEFLAMVNDEDEEYKCWHTNYEFHEYYFLTQEEAKKAVYENAISGKKKDIEEHKDITISLEKELKELEAHFENIKTPTK